RKLNEFDRQSSTIVSNISALEGALKSGTAQVVADFNGFSATTGFPSYDTGDLEWVKETQLAWNKRRATIDATYISEVESNNQYDRIVQKVYDYKELTDEDVEFLVTYSDKNPSKKLDKEIQEALNRYFGIEKSKDAVDAMSKGSSIYDYFNIYKAVIVETVASSEKAGELSRALKAKDFSKFMDISEDVMKNSEWIASFEKVNNIIGGEGLSIDDLKSGWNAIKVGKKPGGLTVKNTAKSIGVLGGAVAVFDGVSTYFDRREQYGEQAAMIDGVAHTGTAVTSIYAGSLIGSAIPIPVVGTVVGAVGGYLVGGTLNTLYDGLVHNDWDLDNFSLW
ncbi:hypothetical protein JOC28_002129, partial [Streptococcus loxodontisalivarius]